MRKAKRSTTILVCAAALFFLAGAWQVMVLRSDMARLKDIDARIEKRLDALTARVPAGGDYVAARSTPALERMRRTVVPVKVEGFNNGSGVVYQSQGNETYVLTAEHVVRPVRVRQASVSVAVGGDWLSASLIDWDPQVDLAVLKVNGQAPAADMSTRTVDVGDRVIAIGGPPGLEGSVSSGDVSGLNRHIDLPDGMGIAGYDGLIQTTVSVTPGSSGGGLFDVKGRLVGIISLSGEDYSYAVPVALAYGKLLR